VSARGRHILPDLLSAHRHTPFEVSRAATPACVSLVTQRQYRQAFARCRQGRVARLAQPVQ